MSFALTPHNFTVVLINYSSANLHVMNDHVK